MTSVIEQTSAAAVSGRRVIRVCFLSSVLSDAEDTVHVQTLTCAGPSGGAPRAGAVQHDLRVAYVVARGDAQRLDERVRDLGVAEALDLSAPVADEVRVQVLGRRLLVAADRVKPRAVLAADAVHEALADEGVERGVDGDRVAARGRAGERRRARRRPRARHGGERA